MAKYTELFINYVEGGGALPASFDLIEGFKDLFLERFCDCEIGFETEDLFKIKLDLKAKLVMPKYKERIDILTNYITQAEGNPTKVHYEKDTTNYRMGKTKSSMTDLPINALDATPSSISESDEVENSNDHVRETKDYGASDEEVIRIMQSLNREVEIILNKLLNEFKPLFMAVY